jgi:hypothetical protein
MESTENTNQKEQFNAIEAIERLKDTQEFKTLLDNQNKAYWESNIGNEVKNIYSSLDGVIKDVLGVDKPNDIKTSDWVKNNLSQLAETKKELEALKSKNDSNSELEKLHKQKVDKLNSLLKEKEQQITSITKKGFESNISNNIDTLLVSKTFNPVYSENVLKDLVSLNKMRIVKNAKETEKGTIYYDENGQAYLDALANPMTLDKVVDSVFSSLYQSTKQGGNAPSDTPSAVTKGDVIVLDMSKVNNKQQFFTEFNKAMASKGITRQESKFLEMQRATMKHYSIDKMSLT